MARRKKLMKSYTVGHEFVKNDQTMRIVSVNTDGTATYAKVNQRTGKASKWFKKKLPALPKSNQCENQYLNKVELTEDELFLISIEERKRAESWNFNAIPIIPRTELVSYFDENGRYIIRETEESRRRHTRFEISTM